MPDRRWSAAAGGGGERRGSVGGDDCEAAVLVLQGVVPARQPSAGATVRVLSVWVSGAAAAAQAGEVAAAKSGLLRGAAVGGGDGGGKGAATASAHATRASPLGRGAIADGEQTGGNPWAIRPTPRRARRNPSSDPKPWKSRGKRRESSALGRNPRPTGRGGSGSFGCTRCPATTKPRLT